MPGYDEVRQTLETTFSNGWDAGSIPVIFDNESIDPPASGPWVRVTIVWLPSENIELGVSKTLLRAYFAVQVFTEQSTGTGESARAIDAVVALMENKTLLTNQGSTVLTYAADVKRIGDGIRRVDQIERGVYQVNVSILVDAY